jgi:hypothetical protein
VRTIVLVDGEVREDAARQVIRVDHLIIVIHVC